MTQEDFDRVVNVLVKDKVLENDNLINLYYRVSADCKIELEPIFYKEKLKEIKLINAECIYPLYKEKYNLPDLKRKNYTDYEYIENNPDYFPVMLYQNDKNEIVNLPDAFYDKNNFLPKGKTIKLKVENNFSQGMLPNTPLIVFKDDIVIVFDQEIIKSVYDTYSYSLENSKEIREYKLTTKGNEGLMGFGKESKYLISNSKLRTVSINSSVLIKIIYKSKEDYEEEIKQEEAIKNDALKNERVNSEKRSSVLNDI
ncbi:hypothetical protein [Flavobacterium channae]|uniref:hypothetical protein n=1 Tax=Flavobacterium channae TaxID=2897181 RepID=UPI001E5EC727|nr:hypothetical protein [Flavobacterium channae]UGS24890.1 hypothetical protein LOS89_06355 [Flavobacterium channae]